MVFGYEDYSKALSIKKIMPSSDSIIICGEKGIRTLGTHSVQRFSRPPHSTTLASLPNLL